MKLFFFRTPAAAVALATMLSTLLALSNTAYAQTKTTPYPDVPAGAWYESSVRGLIDIGALNTDETYLRPNDLATRAEVAKLLVQVNKHTLVYPAVSSFNDVALSTWYSPYIEAAARAAWMKGDGNCYGTKPCYARPADGVNRAEAAALLVRAFSLSPTDAAPVFFDNTNTSWYKRVIQIAADHCVLMGDDTTHLVRPSASMNRAEMVAMFYRASQNLQYGTDCTAMTNGNASISSVTATSMNHVRVNFNADLNATTATDATRYNVTAADGSSVSVTFASQTSSRTVDLTLANDLQGDRTYRIAANNLRTVDGVTFSDSMTFVALQPAGHLTSTIALSSTKVRLQFSTDLNASRAGEVSRYNVHAVQSNNSIQVDSAALVSARTVDLTLHTALTSGTSYVALVSHLLTDRDVDFTDSATFTFAGSSPMISSVSTVSSAVLRLNFTNDLDQTIAENVTHYRVNGNSGSLAVNSAQLVNSRLVELTLNTPMQSQRQYTVTAQNLRTSDNLTFSASGTTLFVGGDVKFTAGLIGAREVPPVVTTMSGTGSFTLNGTGLTYDITLSNTSGSTLTAAHFHRGVVGVSGPVVMPITFSGNHASGTWTNLTEQDRNDLLNGNIYVNVHTTANPNGAIRGQVTKI